MWYYTNIQPIAEDKYSIIIPSLAKSVFHEMNLLTLGPSGLSSRNIMQANRVLRHVSGIKNVEARDTGLYTAGFHNPYVKKTGLEVRLSRVGIQNDHLILCLEFLKDPVYQSGGWRCVSHYIAVISIKWDKVPA